MKTVILAGGKGTRLGLNGIPKPMVPVLGKPLLQHIVENVKASGLTDFIFLNGHLGHVIEEHFGDGSKFGVNIEHVHELHPLGTAGCFRQIADRLTEPFLVIYGDILFDIDFASMVAAALRRGGAGTLFVHPNDHPHDSDLLSVDFTGKITAFYPKPHAENARLPNLVSAAIYVLYPNVLKYIPDQQASDWGKDIFETLCREERLYAYRSCEYAKDVGTPDRLQRAEAHLAEGRLASLNKRSPKQCIFLDRDGVINVEKNGIFDASELRLIDGAASAIRFANRSGIPVICVTNQPAIAKGQMDWSDLEAVHAELDCLLAEAAGAFIDAYYVCPHHPEKGWPGEVQALKIECSCRKPKPGMLQDASVDHGVDLRNSWIVGDRYCDIASMKAVGGRGVLVQTGHSGNDRPAFPHIKPDFIASDISAAINYIVGPSK